MARNNHKHLLGKEQQLAINQLHNLQIAIEIIIVVFALTLFTINIASVWHVYGNTNVIIMALSATVLLTCAASFTYIAFNLKKMDEPLKSKTADLRDWLILTWCWIPVFIIVEIIANTAAVNTPLTTKDIFVGIVIFCFLATTIAALITTQTLWKRLTKRKRFPLIRPIIYSVIAVVMILVTIFATYTVTENIKYRLTTVSDDNLELGQTEVRQIGKDGQKQIVHNLIFGLTTSTSQTDAIDQVTAMGTRRYQYMYCSNGGYIYYTADQFKNPSVGFTHQSPDDCTSKGYGTETTVADTPPAKTVVQRTIVQQPPSSFSCYTLYSESINCYSY